MIIFIDTFRKFWEAEFQYTNLSSSRDQKRYPWYVALAALHCKNIFIGLVYLFPSFFAFMFLGWGS